MYTCLICLFVCMCYFSSHPVCATGRHTSMCLTTMTRRWTTTTSKTLRTPASSTSPASSISLLPLFSQRANLSGSLATRIVRNFEKHEWICPKISYSVIHLFMCVCLCVLSPGPFVLSALSLYIFLLFIMFHPVQSIDDFLEVRHAPLLGSDDCSLQVSVLF